MPADMDNSDCTGRRPDPMPRPRVRTHVAVGDTNLTPHRPEQGHCCMVYYTVPAAHRSRARLCSSSPHDLPDLLHVLWEPLVVLLVLLHDVAVRPAVDRLGGAGALDLRRDSAGDDALRDTCTQAGPVSGRGAHGLCELRLTRGCHQLRQAKEHTGWELGQVLYTAEASKALAEDRPWLVLGQELHTEGLCVLQTERTAWGRAAAVVPGCTGSSVTGKGAP